MASAQIGLRSFGVVSGNWVRRRSYLTKWLVLGTAIGIIAGLGAVVFYEALDLASKLLLGDLGGYTAPGPLGEGGMAGTGHFVRWWAIPLVVTLGGLISGVLVFTFAPEAEGHGTDAAIDAVHRNPRMIRVRAVVVKIISSAITIGSGGSGGREGPTAQISAGFGSLLARTLDLTPEDGRIAVSVGIGSGIGAIFGAPLGGAVLAADIVYADDFEVEALVPGLITSIVAYTVFGFIETFSPLFGYASGSYRFDHPVQLLWFAVIGVIAGFVGILYSTTFYGAVDLTKRLPGSRMFKPAVGGLLVGLLALAIPQVLGTGYGWVQHALSRPELLSLPLWIVLVLPLARILATALSIGSGGSGGIFGPGMVIGAFIGAAVWRLLEPIAPGIPHSPASFVVIGMMACFGSIARAPLAVMLMVAEMTGSLTVLAPAMVAVGIAYLIVRRSGQTIYRSQLRNREEAQSARLRLGLPLLGRVGVSEAMAAPRLVLAGDVTVSEALDRLDSAGVEGAPVVDVEQRYLGVVSRELLGERSGDSAISRHVDAAAPSVRPAMSLDEAVDALADGQTWLAVLDDARHVVGVLALGDVVRAYTTAQRADVRRMSGAAGATGIAELTVAEGSELADHSIAQTRWPDATMVVSVRREDSVLAVHGTTVLHAGDVLTVLARPDRMDAVRALADANASRPSQGPDRSATAR